jgi:IclR family KDG regulon transcriptional repressor
LTDYTVGVLEDAIRILEALHHAPSGLTLAQITSETGLVKNKVFRILYTLEKHQLVERDEGGVFRLGLRWLEYGQHVQGQTRLLAASSALLDWLVEETSESIFLGVVSSSDALCIDARESPRSIRLFAQVGRRAPLHSGGVPKTLLAYLPDDERRHFINIYTSGDKAQAAELENSLCEIRRQGYAIVIDELDVGATSVAAPIRDYQGQVIAAVSIAGPSYRFTEEMIDRYIHLVLMAAEQISHALGYSEPQPQP